MHPWYNRDDDLEFEQFLLKLKGFACIRMYEQRLREREVNVDKEG